MANLIMIYGESGTGKTTSLRNFQKGEVGIINPLNKPLPFKNDLVSVTTRDYKQIKNILEKCRAKTIVIDDSSHLMTSEMYTKLLVKSYDKFSEMAFNMVDLLAFAASLPADKNVYFFGLLNSDDFGKERYKTVGKMIDNTETMESRFTIVLKTKVEKGKYFFCTHNSGSDTVKSPLGMFEDDLIDNDLRLVDDTIRSYYGMPNRG